MGRLRYSERDREGKKEQGVEVGSGMVREIGKERKEKIEEMEKKKKQKWRRRERGKW